MIFALECKLLQPWKKFISLTQGYKDITTFKDGFNHRNHFETGSKRHRPLTFGKNGHHIEILQNKIIANGPKVK